MIAVLVVTVLVNGSLVATSLPAQLVDGTVAAPVDPFVRLIARRITADDARGRLTFERDGRCLTVVLGSRSARTRSSTEPLPIAPYVRDGRVIIPLAATARALGAAVRYDAAAKRIEIVLPPLASLSTVAPVASWAPPSGPLATFTPEPTPAPRATLTGVPRPRRTPILLEDDS